MIFKAQFIQITSLIIASRYDVSYFIDSLFEEWKNLTTQICFLQNTKRYKINQQKIFYLAESKMAENYWIGEMKWQLSSRSCDFVK